MEFTDFPEGPPQFILLGITVATVAYLRSIPVRELKDSLSNHQPAGKFCMFRWIQFQLFILNIIQFGLAALAALLGYRIATGSTANDDVILAIIFWSAVAFLALHFVVNGEGAVRSLFMFFKRTPKSDDEAAPKKAAPKKAAPKKAAPKKAAPKKAAPKTHGSNQ